MARMAQETDEEILARIRDNISQWMNYYADNNERYRKDVKFIYDENGQWTQEEINEYNDFKKPRLTLNMLPRLINNLVGEFAENSPEPKVRSTDTAQPTPALQKKIDLRTGLLRNTSFSSKNDVVYQTAFHSALTGGYGAFRIVVEPESEISFLKVIRYKIINDPTKAYWDPIARDKDKSDGNYCGECKVMSKAEFKSKYPDVEIPNSFDCEFSNFDWITKDDIVIADHYEKEYFDHKIVLLSNGDVVDADIADQEIKKLNHKAQTIALMQGITTTIPEITKVDEKTAKDYKIKFYRIIGNKILERSVWDGKKLPIPFMAGIRRWIDGKERTYSFIHWMRDAQRMYNYSRSEFIYRIMLSRYEPYIASEKNVEGYEEDWRDAHRARSVLVFKNDPSGYTPKRVTAAEPPQALLAEMQQSLSDLQQIPGRFDANLGAPSNETSGIAINNRQRAGNLSVKLFTENANDAIQSGSKIVLDLFKTIYDTERTVQIVDNNNEQKNIVINQNGGTDEATNMTDGDFDVEVHVGSSFEIQKTEAVNQLTKAYAVMPDLASISQDVFIKNLDIKEATKLADRARTYLIPQITTNENKGLSQDQILMQNMQNKEMQDRMDAQQQQMSIMIEQMKAQDDHLKSIAQAFNNKINAIANLLNAQTTRDEAQQKGVLESAKLQAEESKSERDLLREELRVLGKVPQMEQQSIF